MNVFDVFITRPFGLVLMFIYNITQSYGVSIIIFTILTKLVVMPFTFKSKVSTQRTAALQPKLNEIKKKYKDDKQKINEETMKLYKKEGVSPTAGCLPMLITFPIMICLYYVVQQPLEFMMGLDTTQIAEIAEILGIVTDATSRTVEITIADAIFHNYDAVAHISEYIVPIDFTFLGLNLAETPSFSEPSILWVLPILSCASSYLFTKVSQKLQGTSKQMEENPTMKSMTLMGPLMSLWFGFILPATLGLYWVVGNITMIIQEIIVSKIIKKRLAEERDERARKDEIIKQRQLEERKEKSKKNRERQLEAGNKPKK